MPDSDCETCDPLQAYPGYLMRRASMAVLSDINARLARFSIRHVDFSVLQIIQANPGTNQSEVGRVLEIKRANMVPLIARLEKQGLVSRKPLDGRTQAMRLTARGRTLCKKSQAVVDDCEQALIDSVPEPLQASVLPVLQAIWRGLEQRTATPADTENGQEVNTGGPSR